MMSNCQPSLRAIASAFGTFGVSMKPNCSATVAEVLRRSASMRHPLVLGHARRVGGHDGQDHIVLVQHLVVLEIVQQRGRREFGIAGQEHRGARHDVRRLLLQALAAASRAAPRCGASCCARMRVPRRQVRISSTMATPNSSGTQAPSSSLSRLAREEGDVDDDERHDQQRRLPQRPAPQLPDHDEAQHAVDHHGGGDRDAVGGGERARGAEQADQQQHADQQQRC